MPNPKRTRILPGKAEGLGYGVCVHNMVAPHPLTVSRFSRDGGHPPEHARRDAKAGRITVRSVWKVLPHGGNLFQTGVRSATMLGWLGSRW